MDSKKKKILVMAGVGGLVVVIVILMILLLGKGKSNKGNDGKDSYANTLKLIERYVEKGEYDRALSLLDKLMIDNPDDDDVQALFDRIVDQKKLAESAENDSDNRNQNISVDLDTSGLENGISSAMKDSIDSMQKVLDESNRQVAQQQKELQALLQKQAEAAEESKQLAEEKRLAEAKAAEQRKIEEEKRKKAEEELAKKNEKLKKEIDSVNEKIRLGKTALATGNISEAINYFNQAKGLMPVSAGEPAFSASKESEMAAALYDASEKTENPELKGLLLREAVAMAKTAVEIDPTDASCHNLIAQDAYAQKDYQTALNEFMKACQYDSSNYSYFYNLGKTQYVLKKYNEAVTSFNTSCKLDPSFSQGRYNLGLAQKALKNDNAALQAFRQAIDINPHYEKAYLEQARILEKRGDHNGAIASYKKVVELNNINVSALMELGSSCYQANRLPEAEDSYRKALALMQEGQNQTLTYYNLSTVLFDEKKFNDSLTYAKKANDLVDTVKDKNMKANICYNYGLVLEKCGKGDDAIMAYMDVLKFNPSHQKTRINLGTMYLNLEPPEVDQALDLFMQVYNQNNKNFEANNNLGTAYLAKEDYKNAVKFYKNALVIDSKNNTVRINLARAYTKNGEYDNAKVTYTELLKMDNQNWDGYLELGKVCLQLGDNASAEKWLVYLQAKNPKFKAAEVDSLLSAINQ